MVTNTANSDTHTITDYDINQQLNFFSIELNAYKKYYYEANNKGHLNLLIPKETGFQNGDNAWTYKNNHWYITSFTSAGDIESSTIWDVVICEIADAKTI